MAPPPPTTVLHLLTRMNVGGPAAHVLSLARHLGPDFDVVVAAGRPDARESELADEAVPVTALGLRRSISPAGDLAGVAEVRRLLAQRRPVILHTHMAKAGTVGRAAALTMRTRPLLVHTFHGHVLEGYFSEPVRRAFLAVERALAARTDRFVAVSPQVRDELLALGIGRPDQYRVVRPGIDVDAYAHARGRGELRARLGVGDAPLVGHVGRLAPVKGVDVLLRALAAMDGVHLVLAGDGPARPDLELLAEQLGVRGRTSFLGWSDRVGELLGDLDVLVAPSRHEGTPLALMEAAAAGCAVVATAVGGVPDVVDDGRTGVLVPRDDAEALRGAVAGLLAAPERRAALGAAAREHARRRFSEAAAAAGLAGVYRELAGGQGPVGPTTGSSRCA